MTFVDEGGHFPQDVRLQCRARLSKKVFCIKGRGGDGIPYTSPPKKQKIVVNGKSLGTCWQYQLGVDAGKQLIMDNLRVQTKGSKYCHFPRRDDYGSAYFKGLLSERLAYKPERKSPWVWEKIPGHERNEALDCRNYATAFKALPVDWTYRQGLKAARVIIIRRQPLQVKKRSKRNKERRITNISMIGRTALKWLIHRWKIRLQFWQDALVKLRAAYLALVDGGVQSYTIDDRSLTRFDLPALLKEIEEAEKKVDELTALTNGRKARKAFGIVPRNW